MKRELRIAALAFSSLLAACGSSEPGASSTDGAGGNANQIGSSGSSGSSAAGAAGSSSGAPVDASDTLNHAEGSTSADAATKAPGITSGGPGCGMPSAAFCDTFDAPATSQGRAGDLDSRWWSAGRAAPQGPTGHGGVFPVGEAVIPSCRTGIPSQVLPDQDSLICDPTASVNSHYLMTAVASQNYGSNSYRIRQPFDFGGRTGKIVFDGTVSPYGGLFGWLSIEVTEDPVAVPSFATLLNYEGGVIPENAFEVQFDGACGGQVGDGAIGISAIHVYSNYQDAAVKPPTPSTCPTYQTGKMNRFEILVSETSIEVHVSPFSTDGVTFGPPTLVYQIPVKIPFSRGYVHITTHNHATLKYSGSFGVPNPVDASVSLWDNVGFDGPIVSSWREYEVPDALVALTGVMPANVPADPYNPTGKAVSTGYLAPDMATGPKSTLHFHGVDLSGVASARLALTAWYVGGGTFNQYALKYRLNGGAWRDRALTPAEVSLFSTPPGIQGAVGEMIDVALSDLVAGDNTLEVVTTNVPQNYPPAIANVDLILATQ